MFAARFTAAAEVLSPPNLSQRQAHERTVRRVADSVHPHEEHSRAVPLSPTADDHLGAPAGGEEQPKTFGGSRQRLTRHSLPNDQM